MDLRYPVQRLAQVAPAAGVLHKGQAGFGDGEPVCGTQAYRGLVVGGSWWPVAAQFGPADRDLRSVLGGVPYPLPACLGERDAVDEALAAQFRQPAPGLLDAHVGGEDAVHLFGGGHPVLDQHRHSQPVAAAGVDVGHRHFSSGTGVAPPFIGCLVYG